MTRTLSCVKIRKSFKQRVVVDDISLRVDTGQSIGIFGPNGAGKTTFFSVLSGLLKPDHGQILIDDVDITYLPLHKRAALGMRYLPQEPSIFRGLTVEQNLLAVLELFEADSDKRRQKIDGLLTEFDLGHVRQLSALAISGGERRRVEIARALVGEPQFLLLDEPLAGIDPRSINNVGEIVKHLKDRNIGVLITDHNVRDLFAIVDYAYVIVHGKVLKHGTPSAIIDDAEVRRIYLGDEFKM